MTTLSTLIDRTEITELVTRLGRWLDGQGGDPATIYDREIVVRSPRGEFRGYDDVLAFIARSDKSGERAQHFHTDMIVAVDDDQAVVTANQFVQFFHPGQAPHRTSGLRVRYAMTRRPDGWRLLDLQMELAWIIGALPVS